METSLENNDEGTDPQTINTGESMKGANIQMMSLNKIKLSRNSRSAIANDDLSGIMQSIKEVGLLQPIGVSKDGTGYSICYGNRRFLACSKLGLKKIPVIIHKHKNVAEADLKNLTENIQRRNISLIEAGRYVSILKQSGLSSNEIATRLGVNKSYVAATLDVFNRVPVKHQKDIDVAVTKSNKTSKSTGKIGVYSARRIVSAKSTYRLNDKQTDYLFEQAKHSDDFQIERVDHYAKKLKSGEANPVGHDLKTKHVAVNFLISETEYERLFKKYVAEGAFKGMSPLFKAIIEGKIAERVRVISNY